MISDQALGLLLSDDMIFSSRIYGAAQGLGLKVITVKAANDLTGTAQTSRPSCVILDLAHSGLNLTEVIQKLKETCSPMPRLVAYGSHVDAASLRAAREAGCDVVLSRSRFVEELPISLPQWLKPGS
jgi:DNA-binding NarL/FixJ family response regulator